MKTHLTLIVVSILLVVACQKGSEQAAGVDEKTTTSTTTEAGNNGQTVVKSWQITYLTGPSLTPDLVTSRYVFSSDGTVSFVQEGTNEKGERVVMTQGSAQLSKEAIELLAGLANDPGFVAQKDIISHDGSNLCDGGTHLNIELKTNDEKVNEFGVQSTALCDENLIPQSVKTIESIVYGVNLAVRVQNSWELTIIDSGPVIMDPITTTMKIEYNGDVAFLRQYENSVEGKNAIVENWTGKMNQAAIDYVAGLIQAADLMNQKDINIGEGDEPCVGVASLQIKYVKGSVTKNINIFGGARCYENLVPDVLRAFLTGIDKMFDQAQPK